MIEKAKKPVYLECGTMYVQKHLGVTASCILDWCSKGCPHKLDGKKKIFSLPEVFKWRVAHEEEILKKKKDGVKKILREKGESSSLKALIDEETHRKLKIKNDLDEGVLTYSDQVQKDAYLAAKSFKEALLSAPVRIAPVLAKITDANIIEGKLIEMAKGVLNQVAESLEQVTENPIEEESPDGNEE